MECTRLRLAGLEHLAAEGGWLTNVTISRLGHHEVTLALYYFAMAFERVLRFDTQCQITKDIVQPLENHSQRKSKAQ